MKAGIFSSISTSLLLVFSVAACSDATAPAAPVAIAAKAQVLSTDNVPGSSEDVAATFDDAASRLMLSFSDSPSASELSSALVAAADSYRNGDMGAASEAIVVAGRALNSLDANGSNPDAAAIRLVLRYASRASTSLAVQSR